jgi:hypothetical protein
VKVRRVPDEELWGKPSTDHFYREMLYIIIYARQKYKDIANNIENICKQKTKEADRTYSVSSSG